jgi:signal transduction histidine kinase
MLPGILKNRRVGLSLLGGLCLLGAVAVLSGSGFWWVPRKVRIGLGQFPLSGLVSELIQQAAKRRNLEIEWVRFEGVSPQPGLERGDFDLTPVMTRTLEREGKFALSPAWFETALGLMSLKNRPVRVAAGYQGTRIGAVEVPFRSFLRKDVLSGAELIFFRDFEAVSESLCSGGVDAIMVGARPVNWPAPELPCGGAQKLEFAWFGAEMSLQYSIAGNAPYRAEVNALYSEFVEMQADGTFAAICRQWGILNPHQGMLGREFLLIRRSNKGLLLGWAVIGLAGAFLVWQNQQNRKARAEAVAASSAKSRFLAMMSHEIRTPLNGVMGMSELLSSSELSYQQRSYVEAIRSSGSELLSVLNDILDISRIEAGRMSVESISFSPATVAESVALLMNRRAAEKSLQFTLIISRFTPVSMRGDPTRVRQILNNLVSNAIKFTDQGHIAIRVGVAGDRDALRLRVSVEDSGLGIDAATQKRLFEPFVQADNSIARRYGGTGLGLAICRELVSLMQGTCGVESVPGKGSLFWFEIPALDAARVPQFDTGVKIRLLGSVRCPSLQEAISEMLAGGPYVVEWSGDPIQTFRPAFHMGLLCNGPPPPGDWKVPVITIPEFEVLTSKRLIEIVAAELTGKPKAHEETGILAGMRVLVAEDNRVNQKVIDSMLRRLGCEVELAENGAVAVERARQHVYDLILMDIHMPEMDGVEATKRIRQFNPRIRILALTAASDFSEGRVEWLEAGMTGWLGKPLDFNSLKERLEGLRAAAG